MVSQKFKHFVNYLGIPMGTESSQIISTNMSTGRDLNSIYATTGHKDDETLGGANASGNLYD